MVERVARGAVHLGRAPQRVGVLHPRALGPAVGVERAVARHDGRAVEQRAQVRGRRRLAGVRPHRHEVGRERRVRAEQRLDARRGRDVGRREQGPQVVQREREHAEHAVRAVDEREALLLAQREGCDPGRGEGVGGRHEGSRRVADLALPECGERDVRERCEVARAPERAELPHHRGDPGVEHRGVRLRDDGARPGAPGRQGREPQELERPHDLALDLRPRSRRVRPHEAQLELRAPLDRDVAPRERPEPGRDAVVRAVVVREPLDDGAARRHRLDRRVGEPDARAVPRDVDHVVDRQRAVAHDDDARGAGRVGDGRGVRRRCHAPRTHRAPRHRELAGTGSVWDPRQQPMFPPRPQKPALYRSYRRRRRRRRRPGHPGEPSRRSWRVSCPGRATITCSAPGEGRRGTGGSGGGGVAAGQAFT